MKHYFSHDSDARNDERIIQVRIRHKAAGYGVYFMILERMLESTNYQCSRDYNAIAYDLRVKPSLVKSVVEDFGLFEMTDDGKFFYSKSFLNRIEEKNKRSAALREAGRRGMEKRWGRQEENEQKETKQGAAIKSKNGEEWTREQYAQQIVNLYNNCLEQFKSSMRPVRKLTPERVEAIMEIYSKFHKSEEITTAFKNAAQSDFLNGRTRKRTTPADFDWIIKPNNFLKCLEKTI